MRNTGFIHWLAVLALAQCACLGQGTVPSKPAYTPGMPAPEGWLVTGRLNSVLETNGIIFLGGQFYHLGHRAGPLVIIDTQTGAAQKPIQNLKGMVTALATDSRGGLFLGGSIFQGTSSNNLAYLKPDGSFENRWNGRVEGIVRTMVLHEDILFVGGDIRQVDGGQRNEQVVAFRVSTGEALPPLKISDGKTPYFNSLPARMVAGAGRIIVQGPRFATGWMGGDLGVIEPEAWEMRRLPFAVNVPGRLEGRLVVAALSDKTLVSINGGGAFATITASTGQSKLPDPYLVGLDASGSIIRAATEKLPTGFIHDSWVDGDWAYLAADITDMKVIASLPVGANAPLDRGTGIVALNLTDGKYRIWPHLAKPANPLLRYSQIRRVVKVGDRLFLAGQFDQFGGKPRVGLAALDLKTGEVADWSPDVLTIWLPYDVFRPFAATQDRVYVGGSILMTTPYRRQNFAAIEAASGRVLDWNPAPDGAVTNLFWRDGALWAEGSFTNINGIASPGLARLEPPVVPGRLAARTAGGVPANQAVPVPVVHPGPQVFFIEVMADPSAGTGRVAGSAETERVVLEASTNLVHWLPIATNSVPFVYEDVEAGRFPYRFYRVRPAR